MRTLPHSGLPCSASDSALPSCIESRHHSSAPAARICAGYGYRAPVLCWLSAVLVATHSLLAVVFDSIILGIAFARISHPKNRGRTILVSNCAVMSRRDGVLKFMFRLADIQRSTVVSPRISAFLYTWGEGFTTAEGERLPVKMQELQIRVWWVGLDAGGWRALPQVLQGMIY